MTEFKDVLEGCAAYGVSFLSFFERRSDDRDNKLRA